MLILSAVSLIAFFSSVFTAGVAITYANLDDAGTWKAINENVRYEKQFQEWNVAPLGDSYTTYSKGLGSIKENSSSFAEPLGTGNKLWWQKKYIESKFPHNPASQPSLHIIFKNVTTGWSSEYNSSSLNWSCHVAFGADTSHDKEKKKLEKNIASYCSIPGKEITTLTPKGANSINTASKTPKEVSNKSLDKVSVPKAKKAGSGVKSKKETGKQTRNNASSRNLQRAQKSKNKVKSKPELGFGGYRVVNLPSESGQTVSYDIFSNVINFDEPSYKPGFVGSTNSPLSFTEDTLTETFKTPRVIYFDEPTHTDKVKKSTNSKNRKRNKERLAKANKKVKKELKISYPSKYPRVTQTYSVQKTVEPHLQDGKYKTETFHFPTPAKVTPEKNDRQMVIDFSPAPTKKNEGTESNLIDSRYSLTELPVDSDGDEPLF